MTQLARDNAIAKSTGYDYLHEGIDLLDALPYGIAMAHARFGIFQLGRPGNDRSIRAELDKTSVNYFNDRCGPRHAGTSAAAWRAHCGRDRAAGWRVGPDGVPGD